MERERPHTGLDRPGIPSARTPATSPIVLAESVSWESPAGIRVLDRVTLAVAREKTGLVGDNGSGKSTLARILAGETAPTSGAVSRFGTVAMLAQDFSPLAGSSVAEALGVQQRLAALARLTAGTPWPDDLLTLDDGWSLESDIAAEFHRLGLSHVSLDRPMGTLSGGETTRILLAALFLKRPDLILLDEPTNNLDRESRRSLYGAVQSWTGGLLVVSHDRELLNLMDRIVELSPHGLRSYGGNFDLYTTQRDAEASAAQHDFHHAAKELRKTRREAQAARERQQRRSSRGRKTRDKMGLGGIALNTRREYGENTTARLAGTFDAKIIERRETLATARARAEEARTLDIVLSPVEIPAGKTVLELENVSFRHSDREEFLFHDLNLQIVGPERVALVGPNGSGKSTLLRLILGQLKPIAGEIHVGVGRVSCLDQKADLLDRRGSVLENFRRWNPDVSETVCRLTLARFLFRTDDVHRSIGTLSGGERLRAALACVLTGVNPPQLLLLDEPTNHLDLSSLANLEQALRLYTGALLVVSHDPVFLERIGVHRTVELGDRRSTASSHTTL